MACGLFWGKSTRVEASDKKKIPCRCKRVVKIRRMGVQTFRPAHQTSKESQTHVENKNNTIGRDFRIQLEGTFECNWKRLHVLEHLWEASDRCNHDFSTHANLPCAINDPVLVVRGGSCVCGGVQQDGTKPSRAGVIEPNHRIGRNTRWLCNPPATITARFREVRRSWLGVGGRWARHAVATEVNVDHELGRNMVCVM